jgi:hypothetical protein
MSEVQAEVVEQSVEQVAGQEAGTGTGTGTGTELAAAPVPQASEPTPEPAEPISIDGRDYDADAGVHPAEGHLASIEAIALTWGGDVGIMLRNLVGKIREVL